MYLVSVVVGFALVQPPGMPQQPEIKWWNGSLSDIARLAPVFVFAFTCHQNIFSIHNEIFDNSLQRVGFVVGSSISRFAYFNLSAVGVYSLIGVVGYASFGSAVSDNVFAF